MLRLPPIVNSLLLALAVTCAQANDGVAASLTVRDAAGVAVPGAVVSLEGADRGPAVTTTTAVVDQRDRQFVPQVTVIQAGTTVRFPNNDSVSHHVYSFARPNAFELPLYKGGGRPEIRFDHAGVITLGCNIHDAMLGWIVVVETPHFGITDDEGSVDFPDLAPGSYRVRVWSPRLDRVKSLDAGSVVADDGQADIAVRLARRLRPAPIAGGSLIQGDY